MAVATGALLSEQLLTGCRERAAGYDRDNRFFQEDFDELKAAGYLQMAMPHEFGGLGMNLVEVGRETRHARAVRAGDRARAQHAQLLGRRRRRRVAQRRQVGRVDSARGGRR